MQLFEQFMQHYIQQQDIKQAKYQTSKITNLHDQIYLD